MAEQKNSVFSEYFGDSKEKEEKRKPEAKETASSFYVVS